MNAHIEEPWAQGVTLLTHETRKWTPEQLEQSNQVERCAIFSGFTAKDEGRSRKLVAVCEHEKDARRIVACVNACAGSSTDWLEYTCCQERDEIFGPSVPFETQHTEMLKKALELKAVRDMALNELREIREAIKANKEKSTADEVRRIVSQRDELLAALKLVRENLRACQAVIHLDGGFDPAYVADAQVAMKVADERITRAEGGAA